MIRDRRLLQLTITACAAMATFVALDMLRHRVLAWWHGVSGA